jgi:hypothetical protein
LFGYPIGAEWKSGPGKEKGPGIAGGDTGPQIAAERGVPEVQIRRAVSGINGVAVHLAFNMFAVLESMK